MGYIIAIAVFIFVYLFSTNPGILLYLIPIGILLYFVWDKRKEAAAEQAEELKRLQRVRDFERSERERVAALEARLKWDKEVDRQQRNRIERVNRPRENYSIVSEVCGVCSSELNPSGLCVSGCKPLEE